MEPIKDTHEKLSDHILENNEVYLKGKSLYVGTTKLSLDPLLNDEELLDELGIFRTVKSASFNKRDFIDSAKAYISEALEKKRKEELSKYKVEDKTDFDPENFAVYIDMDADSNYKDMDKIIIDKKTGGIVHDISVHAYRHALGVKTFTELLPSFPLAKKVFDPYKILETKSDKTWKGYSTALRCNVTHINECNHPEWRYNRDLSQELTKEEKYFIESSFVDKETLQYYIDASYHTIVDKMWAYPMLFGIKGTGKTTLVEMLIPCVGSDNYRKAPQNALHKEFNGFKKNKRLVLMDEMVANTDKAINILKSDANKEFNIEEKNKEAEAVKNFVSMWIATNNISDWKFTHDERRFSVLELTSKTTQERGIKDEFFEKLTERIESSDFANAFFNYLEANKSEEFNTMAPFRSKAFYNVVYESLAQWQMTIVDTITMGEKVDEVYISDLFDQNDRFAPTTHKKIIDFLDNYRHDGDKLGEYIRGKSVRSSSIIPIEKYRAPINRDTSFDALKGEK